MILKGLREKSNQKFINKLLGLREVKQTSTKMASVGVILSLNEFDDYEAFRAFFTSLKINPNKIKFIAFTEDDKSVEMARDVLFSVKQVGWKGKIKSSELESFLDTEFDVLVSYFKQNNSLLDLATAKSKAIFKIGLSNTDERLNDLILDVNLEDFDIFKQETTKYLTILKKI